MGDALCLKKEEEKKMKVKRRLIMGHALSHKRNRYETKAR
jgi:hypothetical protein